MLILSYDTIELPIILDILNNPSLKFLFHISDYLGKVNVRFYYRLIGIFGVGFTICLFSNPAFLCLLSSIFSQLPGRKSIYLEGSGKDLCEAHSLII